MPHERSSAQTRTNSASYDLPHHGVLKPQSKTTKLRVVFNGSSKIQSGKSLNDILHTGAKLQAGYCGRAALVKTAQIHLYDGHHKDV